MTPHSSAIIVALITFVSTISGGLFAIRFRSKLHYIMGFTAGVLLGVVAFDIFPEIINQISTYGFNPREIMIALVAAFLLFHILEKSLVIHHTHEGDYAEHKHPQIGMAQALALTGHSFMDGVGIGLGFQVSTAIGLLVAIAVISHDFTDGMNTITLMLSHNNTDKKAKLFLFFDAVAPVLGVLLTLWVSVSQHFLVLYLAFFAGFLLYIGASDILPEAHSKHSSWKTVVLTVIGAVLIFAITHFV